MAYASSHKESEEGREHRQKQEVTAQHPQMEASPVLKHGFLRLHLDIAVSSISTPSCDQTPPTVYFLSGQLFYLPLFHASLLASSFSHFCL